jgi:hypothetical protein
MAGKTIGSSTTWLAEGGNFTPALAVLIEARRAGQDFSQAWPMALNAVDPCDREVLHETARAWKAEYQGERSYGGSLLAALTAMLDEGDTDQRGDCRLVA